MYAKMVLDRILVRADYQLSDCHCLETDCMDYNVYTTLPKVVEKDGKFYGLTGWNSDLNLAYYKDTASMAVEVRSENIYTCTRCGWQGSANDARDDDCVDGWTDEELKEDSCFGGTCPECGNCTVML